MTFALYPAGESFRTADSAIGGVRNDAYRARMGLMPFAVRCALLDYVRTPWLKFNAT